MLVGAILFGLLALGYLCALVRVSELDLACQRVREDCRKRESVIGGLAITHAALTDVSRVDRTIADLGLKKPASSETLCVSADLHPGREPLAGTYRRGEPTPVAAWADMHNDPRW